MKQFYRIAGCIDGKPVRLLTSIGLSFTVMLFINGFIGSMGGFPVFLAFGLVFFLLRTLVSDGNRITHQLAMTSRQEVGHLLFDYSAAFLVLWGMLRAILLVSRVTGWGNIKGATLVEYLRELLETSLLEKWAYLAAGIVMFAFVLSLFPLLVIRESGRWLRYALIDGGTFALLSLGINGICRQNFEWDTKTRATCLIDHLLRCGRMEYWQEMASILLLLLLTVGIGVFVFFYASSVYGPKPGFIAEEKKKGICSTGKKKMIGAAAFLCSVAATVIVAAVVLFMPAESTGQYTKVAEFLTKDTHIAPIEYGGTVYVPVAEDKKLDETGIARGYLAEKKETCDSRFYRMAVANLLYTDETNKTDLIQMSGRDEGTYAPASQVEKSRAWERDTVFLVWDEDWEAESAYTHETTGYTACNKDFIRGLRAQFKEVTYRASDFSDYDAYFTIRGYQNMDQVLEENPVSGDWAGCILVKNNKFYFGNYENQITGISLQQLKDVLGGNS